MADPNQTPQRGNWVCPCSGCQKARKQAFMEVLEILDNGGDAYSKINAVKDFINKK